MGSEQFIVSRTSSGGKHYLTGFSKKHSEWIVTRKQAVKYATYELAAKAAAKTGISGTRIETITNKPQ